MEARVNTANPALYIRTRPKLAPTANGHDEDGCDDQVAHEHPQQVADVAWF
jgi:hypothetical protein